MEERPSVGVIAVNWNGKDILRTCIESFDEKTQYENADIIVFDNNSDDGSKEMIREDFPDVKLIDYEDNIGFVGGENEAFLETDYDIYFFLNNDTKALNEGWLTYLVETATSDERIGIVGPKVFMSEGIHGGGFFTPLGGYRRVSDDPSDFTEIEDVDWVSGAQILIKRSVLEDIGLFDEVYWPAFMEEVDLCFRAKQGGHRVVYDPRAKIRHFQNETVHMNLQKFYTQWRHEIRFRYVNYPPLWLLIWQLKAVWDAAGTFFERDGFHVSVRENGPGRLKWHLMAYLWNLKRIGDTLEGRRERERSYTGETDLDYWQKHRTLGDDS